MNLFARHFPDPVAALARLDSHLANVALPLDIKRKVRELSWPPDPAVPNGLRSWIYYHVPGAKSSSLNRDDSKDPLHPSFLNSTDGVGLNLGCPVRLLRGLDALAGLKQDDQKSPRDAINNAVEHLSAVEELLWATGWKTPVNVTRGGTLLGASGDVDWAIEFKGVKVFLEAKFRHSDWARLSDRGSFLIPSPHSGFLSNALHKFPTTRAPNTLHVVGSTIFEIVTDEIIELVHDELVAAPQIDAVIFRRMTWETEILTIDLNVHRLVRKLVDIPLLADYPYEYGVPFHRQSRDQRVSKRTVVTKATKSGQKPKLHQWSIRPRGQKPSIPNVYRMDIPSYRLDGEPNLVVVPRFL